MARRKPLSASEIAARMKDVPGWTRRGRVLERTWTFGDFPEALAFINRVGALAEDLNHHPDIQNSWNTVVLRLTTHDAGALTDLDFVLAERINSFG